MDLRKKLKKLKKVALPRRGVSAASSDLLKRQPHLVPRGISMGGFVRHTLILEPEFCVVGEQPLLAGQHKPLAALLSGIGPRAFQYLRKNLFTFARNKRWGRAFS